MCLAYPEVSAVAQFCSIGAEFINVRVLWRVGAQILSHDSTAQVHDIEA